MTDFVSQNNQWSEAPPPSFAHLATNATTVLKTGGGVLQRVIVNTKGASSNTLTLYDNTAGSGTVIAVIDTTAAVAPQVAVYNLSFKTGLTAVLATGTAADVTITFF